MITSLLGLLTTGVYRVLPAWHYTIIQPGLVRTRGLFIETDKSSLIVIRFVATPVPILLVHRGATALVGREVLTVEDSWSRSLRHTTLGRTPLDEWSARRRDLYLSTHETQKRQISMLSSGFEPTTPVRERPQTHALDCAATGIRPAPI
jgi:hypothetical protein